MSEKYTHGGEITVKYDHSVNLNPLGFPESAREAYYKASDELEKYPDREHRDLCSIISEKEGYPADDIICGAGAADLIYRTVYAVRPAKAVIVSPSFSEYERALVSCGCEIMHIPAEKAESFPECADILFVCSPNNPTGMSLDHDLLLRLSEKCRQRNTVMVIDESFVFFSENRQPTSVLYQNGAVIIRSLTKIYSMPALRVGYLLCRDKSLKERIKLCGQSWSIGTPSLRAAAAALREQGFETQTAKYVRTEREYLSRKLTDYGLEVFPSEVNFLLIHTDIPLADLTLRFDTAIRDCRDMFGVSGYYRIAVRPHKENEHLIDVIGRCINEA